MAFCTLERIQITKTILFFIEEREGGEYFYYININRQLTNTSNAFAPPFDLSADASFNESALSGFESSSKKLGKLNALVLYLSPLVLLNPIGTLNSEPVDNFDGSG